MGSKYMVFQMASGHELFLNNFILILILAPLVCWVCLLINTHKLRDALHLTISFILTFLYAYMMVTYRLTGFWWHSGFIVLAIGFGKELYDKFKYNKFDWKDIGFDCIGVVSAMCSFWLMY